jgi:hypothetical protein
MDQSARKCSAPLCGWGQTSGELIFEVRDSAELEHFRGSHAGGACICAADAKERHGHVLGHGEGWQEAWVVKKKAEGFVAKPSEFFIRKMSHALSIQKDRSGIGGLKQTENVKQESPAVTIRAVKLAKHSRIERNGDVVDRCLSGLVPIGAMAAESLAGKNGIHFQNGMLCAPSSQRL